MPDRQITHDDVVAKGDKVLIRWTMTGIPRKEVVGIPSGDKPVTITGFDLFRFLVVRLQKCGSNLVSANGHSLSHRI
jgi:predicted ester cyclase